MRKIFASLTLVALALTATPALAHDREGDDNPRISAKVRAALNKKGWAWGTHQFALVGTVTAVGTNSLTINVSEDKGLDDEIVNGSATVMLNADTKIYGKDKAVLTFSDVKVGDKVIVAGTVSDSVLTASVVLDKSRPQVIVFGSITAKTDDSVTVTNSTTGQSQTVAVNGDTNIAINGEEGDLEDISVGDVGWIKIKNAAGEFVARVIRLFR